MKFKHRCQICKKGKAYDNFAGLYFCKGCLRAYLTGFMSGHCLPETAKECAELMQLMRDYRKKRCQ